MKIYDTNYGPDTFGRIRMGLITEMFLSYDGFQKPDIGDLLRISCMFKGVVRDDYTVEIVIVSECADEKDTVLIRVSSISNLSGKKPKKIENLYGYHVPSKSFSHLLH